MSLNWALLEVGVSIALRGNLNFSWCLVAVGETRETYMSSDQNPSCLLYMQLYSDYDKSWAKYSDLNRRVVTLNCHEHAHLYDSEHARLLDRSDIRRFSFMGRPGVGKGKWKGKKSDALQDASTRPVASDTTGAAPKAGPGLTAASKTDTKPPKETSVLLPVRCILNV